MDSTILMNLPEVNMTVKLRMWSARSNNNIWRLALSVDLKFPATCVGRQVVRLVPFVDCQEPTDELH